MGSADRIIRVIIAVVIGVLYHTTAISGIVGAVLLSLAVALALTSTLSFCPLYVPFGMNSCPINGKNKNIKKPDSADL